MTSEYTNVVANNTNLDIHISNIEKTSNEIGSLCTQEIADKDNYGFNHKQVIDICSDVSVILYIQS